MTKITQSLLDQLVWDYQITPTEFDQMLNQTSSPTWLDKINWVSTPPTQEEYTVLIDKLITEVLKVPE